VIRIVIADDHHLVRQGIRGLLEKNKHILVVGEASNGMEAIEMTSRLKPDVLVLDINMPRMGGLEVTREVHGQGLPTQVLILSMYSDESLVKKAFQNGARGYLLKQSVSEDLLQAIHSTSIRETYISPALTSILDVDSLADLEKVEGEPIDRLTTREREIFKLIAEGYKNNAIAEELEISIKTVEKHRASLMDKLGVDDMAGLVRMAIKYGIIFVDG
jgi:DNA-binding NarL/FixJ family response regulator